MIVVVPVDPPRDGLVLGSLVENTSITPAEASRLYEATLVDVIRTVDSSGGELLVNYRKAESIRPSDYIEPEGKTSPDVGEGSLAESIRSIVTRTLEDGTDVRVEPQIGSTRAGRVGNTVTHLLEQEDHSSVGVLEPTVPLVGRTEIDGAAMSIRRNDVVLGPSPGGDIYLACFAEPIDFTDVFEPPALATLADRAAAAGLQVGFAPMLPTVETVGDLCSTVAGVRARQSAGGPVPDATSMVLDELGLRIVDGPMLSRRDR